MTTNEEMAVIGATVTERARIGRRVAALHAEAQRIGDLLCKIGVAVRLMQIHDVDISAIPTSETVENLFAELNATHQRQRELSELVKQFNLDM
jgi:hypothetical protein